MATESDSQIDSIAPPLQSRRLRLRNAHVRASPLPAGPYYTSSHHRRRRSSSASAPRPQVARSKTTGSAIDDYAWESEEDDDTGSADDSQQHLFRRHTYNAASTSLLSASSSSTSSTTRGVSPSYSYGSGINGRRNRSRDATSRHEAHYIEYLERQLAEVTTQLQNFSNPTANTSQAANIRRLTQEVKHLTGEVEEWETRYDLAVKEHSAGVLQVDRTLRAEIQKLETKLEAAEECARVANQNLEKLRKRCKELEGVEQENKTLEFRIQALSELLADSTRNMQPTSTASSRRTSAIFLKRISSSLSNSSDHPVKRDAAEAAAKRESRQARHTPSLGAASDFGVTDPIDGAIATMDYDDALGERSMSAMSTSVPNYSSGTMIPHSPSMESLPSATSRRMRRFRSGTEPRTLVLPSAAAIPASSSYGNGSRDFHSPPASECDQLSRPGSACSVRSTHSLPTSDYPASEYPASDYPASEYPASDYGALTLANVGSHDGNGLGSLFAELSRAHHDPDRMSMSGTTNPSDSIPHTPASYAHRPSSPTFSDAFSLLPESLSHNHDQSAIKVLDTIPDPAAGFYGKRSPSPAIDSISQTRSRSQTIKPHDRTWSLGLTSPSSTPRRTTSLAPPTSTAMHRCLSSPQPEHHLCHACGALNSITPRNVIPRPGPRVASHSSTHLSTPTPSTTKRHPSRSRSRTPVPTRRQRALSITFGKEGVDDAVDAIWLWIRFIIAVVVALGLAFKDAPQLVITNADEDNEEEKGNDILDAFDHVKDEERERDLKKLEGTSRGEVWIED